MDKYDEMGTIANRLLKGIATEGMLKKMEIEEEIFSEFEYRDLRTEHFREKWEQAETENKTIKAENDSIKAENEALTRNAVSNFSKLGISAEQIAQSLGIDIETVRKYL